MSKELLPWEAEEISLSPEKRPARINDMIFEGDDEDDFLVGVTCNPDAPEECESCQ